MGIIIAGERSGVGKTTITLALLSWLTRLGKSIQSFKVGPDYIDPMFHTAITGKSCRNLDPILTSPDYVKWCFDYYTQDKDIAIVEGVMGLFDGVPNSQNAHYGSTAYIAKLLNLSVILTLDCSKISSSISAIASGYINFDPEVKIVGVILNKVASEKHLSLLKVGLEKLNIPIMGVWFKHQKIELPSRHLGLIPTEEVTQHQQIFQQLGELAKQNINWQLLNQYLYSDKLTKKVNYFLFKNNNKYPLKIAIAKDKSFNFYYQDNLDILKYLGIELIEVSPLEDKNLPSDIHGIYLGGGFPEIFASQLSENKSFQTSIKKKIENGIPTYAECGGMMYLSAGIEDFRGDKWEMVGILPHFTVMSNKLTIGFRQVKTLIANDFININQTLMGHEFHRAVDSFQPTPYQIDKSSAPMLELKDYYTQKIISYQGWQRYNVFGSYLHLHFGELIPQLETFLQGCLSWRDRAKNRL
ncbi:cobyrinate a,c-diamide synthase [Cyanobacterium sp. Dongsha4]|uniref:cobyrinate a,c-diamide synthase n=1 Tax=Cyanobacterium sp. DS4 TaxID=2878255 RepID=UPI002E8099BF|nr:cobyrinate a,c-diamide synthase [Cyanobacterium sp. Dongsha4]WVL00548.1 cobyrinate a,c-diamide synthase [Cyanobacterium sp. Dongsha4]